jgi:hypothetical protein
MPDANRAASGIAALSNPVAAGCRDAIAATGRTLFGQAQITALLQALKSSPTRFHVLVSPVPLGQYYVDPYDRAEGYAAERLQLLDALRDPANGIKNVVVVSGGAGGVLTSELRLQTLEAGGAIGTRIREFATGRGRSGLLGALPDAPAWRQILHGALPNGVGATCAALATTSYLRVTVTPTSLSVSQRDPKRRPVVDDVTGQQCGSVTMAFTP